MNTTHQRHLVVISKFLGPFRLITLYIVTYFLQGSLLTLWALAKYQVHVVFAAEPVSFSVLDPCSSSGQKRQRKKNYQYSSVVTQQANPPVSHHISAPVAGGGRGGWKWGEKEGNVNVQNAKCEALP